MNIAGNILTFHILLKTELGFKLFFTRLIMILCVFDTFGILFNISIFSGPFLSETYRHQV